MTNFSNTAYHGSSKTIKMDKTFDFGPFFAKTFQTSDQLVTTATTQDDTIHQGQLRTSIQAGNGTFDMVTSYYGFSLKNETSGYGLGPTYPSLASGCFITENPAPKLPRKALETVIEWYRRITEKNGEEAQVVFYWNQYKTKTITDKDGVEHILKDIPGVHIWQEDLFSYTPLQYNHGTLTEVAPSDTWYEIFNNNFGMYVETHSHNKMDAFASGTDEANSANDGFQLVFGRLDTEHPVMYSWMTMSRVMRLGMKEEELAKIMEVNPSSHYDQSLEKVLYDVNDLVFDDSLFDTWDKQILVRPVYKAAATKASGYGYVDYTGYWPNTKARSSWTPKKTRTTQYAEMSQEKKEEFLYETFMEGLESHPHHSALFEQNPVVTYQQLVPLMVDAFMKGYLLRDDKPLLLSEYNKGRIAPSVRETADAILETFIEDNTAE